MKYLYSAIIGIFLAFAVSNYIYFKFSIPVIPQVEFTKQSDSDNLKKIDKDFILKRNIFNIQVFPPVASKKPEKEEKKEEQQKKIEITEEKFDGDLIGIVYGKKKYALIYFKNKFIILDKNNEKQGLKLIEITPFFVVINYNNKNYKLELYEKKDKFPKITKFSKKNLKGGTLKFNIPRREVLSKFSDINKILNNIFIAPYYENGKLIGYKIDKISPYSVLRKIGLKNGDIIVRINGEEVKNPEVMLRLFSRIKYLKAVAIDLYRNKTPLTILVDIT